MVFPGIGVYGPLYYYNSINCLYTHQWLLVHKIKNIGIQKTTNIDLLKQYTMSCNLHEVILAYRFFEIFSGLLVASVVGL